MENQMAVSVYLVIALLFDEQTQTKEQHRKGKQ